MAHDIAHVALIESLGSHDHPNIVLHHQLLHNLVQSMLSVFLGLHSDVVHTSYLLSYHLLEDLVPTLLIVFALIRS